MSPLCDGELSGVSVFQWKSLRARGNGCVFNLGAVFSRCSVDWFSWSSVIVLFIREICCKLNFWIERFFSRICNLINFLSKYGIVYY